MNIAVVVLPDPFVSSAQLRGIVRFASSAHWTIRVWQTGDPRISTALQRWRPRGLILNVADPAAELPLWNAIRRPKVFIQPPGPDQLPSADIDNHAVGRMGVEHLLDQGYHNLAFCGVSEWWAQTRYAGFVEACQQKGRAVHDNRSSDGRFPGWHSFSQHAALQRWLSRLPRPVGVLAACDDLTVPLLSACERLGLRVPDDVAILGVDNRELLCFSRSTPISSIAPDYQAVGMAAARMLADQIAGRGTGTRATLVQPVGVMARRSTEMAGSADARLARAVALIRSGDARTVVEVIAQTQVSRSWLEQQFRRVLDRSPGQEIRRARLGRARQMLAETSLDLATIALRAGFASLPHMSAAFRSAFGTPPGAYRRNLLRNG